MWIGTPVPDLTGCITEGQIVLSHEMAARGVEVRRLVCIVGETGLTEGDRHYLSFAARFETEYVGQGAERRSIVDRLTQGWQLLDEFSATSSSD